MKRESTINLRPKRTKPKGRKTVVVGREKPQKGEGNRSIEVHSKRLKGKRMGVQVGGSDGMIPKLRGSNKRGANMRMMVLVVGARGETKKKCEEELAKIVKKDRLTGEIGDSRQVIRAKEGDSDTDAPENQTGKQKHPDAGRKSMAGGLCASPDGEDGRVKVLLGKKGRDKNGRRGGN